MGKQSKAVNPERKRQRFSPEFKVEAVRLLELGQKPATQLALELGVARNKLYQWQEQIRAKGKEAAFRERAGRPPKDEQGEVARLKAELKRVTEERDILKKAAAYFAKELG
jgi:transposase